jgi:thioredoxin
MKGSMKSSAKPYVDLVSQDAVEAMMEPGAGPAVVDFWSSTCGPCRAMAPAYEAVAREYGGEPVTFYKLQTDAHPELAAPFRVRAVPTLIFVHDGEILDAVVGAMDGPRLAKKVDWLLSRARGDGLFARLFGGKKRSG